MERLPTVEVDATAIEPRHLIHDGQQIVVWTAAGPRDDSLPRIGTLEVGDGDTVQCVRVADWLTAVREREAATA